MHCRRHLIIYHNGGINVYVYKYLINECKLILGSVFPLKVKILDADKAVQRCLDD